MTQTPRPLTQTPLPPALTDTGHSQPLDLVSDVLNLVRLQGSIFLRADFHAPWAYASPPGPDIASALVPGASSVVLFHIIGEGRCWIRMENGSRHELNKGDVVVMPYGDAHEVGFPDGTTPVPITDLLPPLPWTEFPYIDHGEDGEYTLVVCGYLYGDDVLFDPVLRALPPLFVVQPPAGPAAAWVSASVEYALMASQSGRSASPALHRLPELLFTEVLRLYLESKDAELSGWLSALRDPLVGRAISLMHADPAHQWTVAELASAVATSRSVLDERFRQLLGRPPIRYLTEWRLSLASGLLRTTQLGVGEIAARVGYSSEEAFSRAFKRELGKAPAHWRAESSAG